MEGATLQKVVKEDLPEEIKFKQRIEHSKGTRHTEG